jgi:hypothetical protein
VFWHEDDTCAAAGRGPTDSNSKQQPQPRNTNTQCDRHGCYYAYGTRATACAMIWPQQGNSVEWVRSSSREHSVLLSTRLTSLRLTTEYCTVMCTVRCTVGVSTRTRGRVFRSAFSVLPRSASAGRSRRQHQKIKKGFLGPLRWPSISGTVGSRRNTSSTYVRYYLRVASTACAVHECTP